MVNTNLADQKPLIVKNIGKSFKKHQVLHDVCLEVQKGQIFGLVGLNGVGKTTLIKIMLGLLSADHGEINFFGINAKDPKSRQNIAYLPEKFYPSQFLKGREFLEISLSFHGKKLDNAELDYYTDILQLRKTALDQKVSKYSKGMGQKLGLLSSFLVQTPLLVLDEPMSGLDPSARIELKKLLIEYKNKGNTIFFTSHILSDIEEICDNAAIIHNGRINFVGTPQEFLQNSKEKTMEKAFIKVIDGN